jgi:hypothetical protein
LEFKKNYRIVKYVKWGGYVWEEEGLIEEIKVREYG